VLYAESSGLVAVRCPNVDVSSLDAPASVVHEEAAYVARPDIQLDIPGQWEHVRVRGHDALAHVPTAARRAPKAVFGEEHRKWITVADCLISAVHYAELSAANDDRGKPEWTGYYDGGKAQWGGFGCGARLANGEEAQKQ
jgi:hypothetical protein